MTAPENPIVFYDGNCALCDGFISGILAHPRADQFHFSTLQGQTFAGLIQTHSSAGGLDSIQVFDPATATLLSHSDATLFILTRLGGLLRISAWFIRLFPRPLRDLGYRAIAAVRYWLFGQTTGCRLQDPHTRALFLP